MRITNLEPGLCESEFALVRFGGDQAKYDSVYQGASPIQPEDIAETIFFWILNQLAHLNVNSLELMPVTQAWSGFAIQRGGLEHCWRLLLLQEADALSIRVQIRRVDQRIPSTVNPGMLGKCPCTREQVLGHSQHDAPARPYSASSYE